MAEPKCPSCKSILKNVFTTTYFTGSGHFTCICCGNCRDVIGATYDQPVPNLGDVKHDIQDIRNRLDALEQ